MTSDDAPPIRVLHIEDEGDSRQEVAAILERHGFHVDSVRSLASGIFTAVQNGADITILDLNVEDSVGLDTLVTFKRCFPHIPVVVLTDKYSSQGLASIHHGADDFLTKTDLDQDHFADLIRFTCERNRRQRDAQKEMAKETRHNLATPLTPIKIQLDVIRRRLTEHPETLDYLGSIERNVQRLEDELHRFDDEGSWNSTLPSRGGSGEQEEPDN